MTLKEAAAVSKPLWVSDYFASTVQGQATVTIRMYITPKNTNASPFVEGDIVCSKERWRLKGDKVVYYADARRGERKHEIWRGASSLPLDAVRAFLRVVDVARCHLQDDITAEECAVTWGMATEAVDVIGVGAMYKSCWNERLKGKALELYGYDANPEVWKITLAPFAINEKCLTNPNGERLSYYDLKQIECSLIRTVAECEERIHELSETPTRDALQEQQLALWKKHRDDYKALIEKLHRIEREM